MLNTQLIEIYSLLISGAGVSLAAFLILKKVNNDNQYLNYLLAIILLSSCFHFIRNYLISSGWIMEFPWVYGSFSMIYLLAPPVTYLYIRGALNDETSLKQVDYFHFIAPLAQFLLSLPYLFSSHEHKLSAVRQLNEFNNLLNATPFNGIPHKLFFLLVFISVATYSILSFRELLRRKQDQKSPHFKSVYNWIRTVAWIMVLMAVLMLINVVVTSFKIGTATNQLVYFGPFYESRLLLFTIVLYKIVFSSGLRLGLPNFAKNVHVIENQAGSTDPEPNQTELSVGVLSSEQVDTYQNILDNFFNHQSEIFTELEFNLEHLSKATQIPKHHWAYFFRYYSEVSFVDLRNKYRIEHAKKIMQFAAYRQYTIEAIGEASGFGSRTTFFNAFKKYENISPGEYFDRIKR